MARTFYGLAIAVLIGFIAYIGRSVIIPFVVAVFLCFLIFTLKENVRRIPVVGRYMPDWVGYMFAFALIGAGMVLFVEIIRSNVETLLNAWPSYEQRLRGLASDLIAFFRTMDFLPQELLGSVAQIQQSALDLIRPLLSQVAGSLRSITSNFLTFITVFLYLVFMLIERGKIFKKISLLGADESERRVINETIADIGVLVRQYITVKTMSNLVTASISYIIMLIIGVQFAGFWALLIFVLNYIPIFGAASAITLPVLLSLVQPDGGGVRMAAIAAVSLIGAEQIMSNGIEPRIVGRSLNLSPLVILFSLGVWGSIWGFAGLLLSVPITVTVMLVLTQFQSTRPIAIMMSDKGDIAELKHSPVG
ncbi:AI-2E family transporter [Hyphococcus flavus]|uniref:AI-2E family transporter n=1 Tax=Hyphococcus flavus TaxID=1866326 RepID=A0AAE9ZG35_9PROT|nr:AI-2E family transporter [Hyphococcus flavus]WDI33185.1 AI-2E family transporter [Hyphococcus flavus]